MGNAASTPTSGTSGNQQPIVAAAPPSACPMQNANGQESPALSPSQSTADSVNPLNNIPALAQGPSAAQRAFLSFDRTTSSIPRSRSNSDVTDSTAGPPASACPVVHSIEKGKGRATAVEEANSAERWVYPSPQQFYNALMRKGKETPEESVEMMVQIHNWLNEKAWDEVRRWEDRRSPNERIELAKFEGKPQDLSPKARFHLLLGSIFPDTYK